MKTRYRLSLAIMVFSGLTLFFLFAAYTFMYDNVKRIAKEYTVFTANNFIEPISAEFERMEAIASVTAGSLTVQDFLKERNTVAFYQKAEAASEIVRIATYPDTVSYSVIAINNEGGYYRFTGGLSNDACVDLYRAFYNAGVIYTIAELDGNMFFCHNMPVYDMADPFPARVGSIIMLTGLSKTRNALDNGADKNIDIAINLQDEVRVSNNLSLEHTSASGLAAKYGVVSEVTIPGTTLSVSAAIPEDALFPESDRFIAMAFIFIGLMMVMIFLLYHYLSRYIFIPMTAMITAERQKLFDAEQSRQKMRIGLLSFQMDAHFVVNTLTSIKNLSAGGECGKAEQMAEGLAVLLRYQYTGQTLINIFDDFEMLELYITIMNIRFNNKFIYEHHVEDALSANLMPGFILQPIVENALTHGLSTAEYPARLTIKGYIDEDRVFFMVTDNGAGIPHEKLQVLQNSLEQVEIGDFPEPGLHGVALANVQRRIRLRFGDQFGIGVKSAVNEGTIVTVMLPLIPDE